MNSGSRLLTLLLTLILALTAAACQPGDTQPSPPAAPAPTAPVPTPVPTATPAPAPAPTRPPSPTPAWTETQITFKFGADDLYGILTLPSSPAPYPAIALITGSAEVETGKRQGADSQIHVDHARGLALDGYAVLRYDPPGVGYSTGAVSDSLTDRTQEALAAARYLRSRPDVRRDLVGLWGISQGGWVIAMAAAEAPEDIGFLISASGAAVSIAEQQIYGFEAQARSAGNGEDDVAKTALFARMLIDWQLPKPMYKEMNEAEAKRLGPGPWDDFMPVAYERDAVSPAENLADAIAVLESIQDLFWAQSLYLKELYLPKLRSIPPDEILPLREAYGQGLLTDPKDYLTRVRCPVLALFGEDDDVVPARKSADLFAKYLAQAGNQDVKIVVFPGVGHSLGYFNAAYWATMSEWLRRLADEG